jgi:hypothetical protein
MSTASANPADMIKRRAAPVIHSMTAENRIAGFYDYRRLSPMHPDAAHVVGEQQSAAKPDIRARLRHEPG